MIDYDIIKPDLDRSFICMAVTLSPKFQIVIPKEIRESLRLRSGMKFGVTSYQGQILIIPLRPIRELKGSLKGMDTTIVREPDREL